MQTLAETDGVAAILAIDTRPEMPNHRRVYHHQLDLQTDELKPVFEGANSLIHLATSFGPSSDGMDAGGAEIDATRRVFEAASAVGIKNSAPLISHGVRRMADKRNTNNRERRYQPKSRFLIRLRKNRNRKHRNRMEIQTSKR